MTSIRRVGSRERTRSRSASEHTMTARAPRKIAGSRSLRRRASRRCKAPRSGLRSKTAERS
ncbi:MAG: hypothetical protein CMJ84_13900 [Planctomycetes bacterium]|nr:hypothetical protein [Planctomycetota bacterium]